MKAILTAAAAISLAMGGVAFAQDAGAPPSTPPADTSAAPAPMPAPDASAPAAPMPDASAPAADTSSYPPCTKGVTDKCTETGGSGHHMMHKKHKK